MDLFPTEKGEKILGYSWQSLSNTAPTKQQKQQSHGIWEESQRIQMAINNNQRNGNYNKTPDNSTTLTIKKC